MAHVIARPVWAPASFNEAAADIAARELFEHTYLDFKRTAYPFTAGGRNAAAKDMAAMAPYGGRLFLGVAEDKKAGVASGLAPIALADVREWLDQVARERIDPALSIETTPLHDPSDPTRGTGIIIVDIAPSPQRVHQVDGTYYGRSDRGNYHMPDSQVEQLLAERTSGHTTLQAPLADEVARYSAWLQPQGALNSGWIIVVAEPDPLRDESMLSERIGENDRYPKWLREHARQADDGFADLIEAHPDLARVVSPSRTGWDSASASRLMGGVELTVERDHRDGHPYRAAVQVHESGRTVVVENHLAYQACDGQPHEWSWRRALGHVVWALSLVKNLAAEAGYRSGATIAVHLGGIKDLTPELTHLEPETHRQFTVLNWTGPIPCPVAELDAYGRVSAHDLRTGDVRRVMDDMFGRLLRSTGLQNPLR